MQKIHKFKGGNVNMGRNWTPAQLDAINASGRDLLVSAGAGSGKTAVLTERIIRRLTDKNSPADITRMLIVTFTKAAAGELKERISSALSEELAKHPGDRRLARQILMLDRAKICTIHSFCLDLLREGALPDLPADFRIADEVEITLLRKNIMNELIEDCYSHVRTHRPIEDFEAFADTFVGTKGDDALADIFLGIENSLSSFTEHLEFIKNFADDLSGDSRDFSKTACGSEIIDLIIGKLSVYRSIFDKVLPEIYSDEKLAKAYTAAFSDDIRFIDIVTDTALNKSYSELGRLFRSFEPTRLGVARGVVISDDLEKAKAARKEFHDERKKLTAKFFSLSPEQLAKNRTDTADALYKLYTLLTEFNDRFSAEKRSRSVIDFGDIERMAYRALVQNGVKTATAIETAARFDEIFIDEYQDVNAIQDAIFAAISNGHNRFMVGDIKQSIYAFRGAEPRIFANYRKEFGRLDDNTDDGGAAIFLSNNFRCDSNVIDFSNIVSGCLFTSGRGDIPFTDDDLLIHSKNEQESGEPIHIALIDGSEGEEDDSVSAREAEYIACEISRLLKDGKKNDGEPIRPSDIAILMRSAKAHSAVLEGVFDKHGIPYYNNVDSGFFENEEILLALCILSITDNPTKDIYLAGALRSPVFGFTLDELIHIRRWHKDGCLYDALRAYCDENDFQKGKQFLQTLDRWRYKAEGMPVDKLLWYIYSDTDLPALVYDKGNTVRRANLMLLYEYARRFEASSFKGLYNFIRYINDILEEKAQLENAKVFGESSDTVKFMTIHQSKGLEFPVCFICGTGKKFNENDLRSNIVMERSLGISLKLADTTGFARYDTPIRQAIVKRLADSQLEEEMRVLYVAMTRARERLYITALTSDPGKLLDSAKEDAARLSRYIIMKNGGYMRWILTALEHHRLTSDREIPVVTELIKDSSAPIAEQVDSVCKQDEPQKLTEADTVLVKEHFDFVYPYSAAAGIPAKLSVSKLVPTLLDGDAAELDTDTAAFSFESKRPLFLDGEPSERRADGAERGTATHLFMQFCDFSVFKGFCDDPETAVREEAARLAERKYITRRAASLIDVRRLTAFFTGDTFARICASPNVWREHRFNVNLLAADFTTDPGTKKALMDKSVLVQGVIDCFFENPDGTLTLIDYKTDYIPTELEREAAEKLLLDRHRLQLLYYKAACEKISAKKVSRVAIYSFALGASIDVE